MTFSFFRSPKIDIETPVDVRKDDSSCAATVSYITPYSIVLKSRSIFLKDRHFYNINEYFEICLVYRNLKTNISAKLVSIDFSFADNAFFLVFKLKSNRLYKAVKKIGS